VLNVSIGWEKPSSANQASLYSFHYILKPRAANSMIQVSSTAIIEIDHSCAVLDYDYSARSKIVVQYNFIFLINLYEECLLLLFLSSRLFIPFDI